MPTSPESLRTLELIRSFAQEQGIEAFEGTRPGEMVLVLPGEDKLNTSCSLICAANMLTLSAFVIRRPDENHVAFYRFLLQRNLQMPGLGYAIDEHGDVFLTGQVPLAAVTRDYLDQILGIVLAGTDEVFNDLLVIGFLGSMRKEWNWRVTREESLSNLEPFRAVLAEQEAEMGRPMAHEAPVDEQDDIRPFGEDSAPKVP